VAERAAVEGCIARVLHSRPVVSVFGLVVAGYRERTAGIGMTRQVAESASRPCVALTPGCFGFPLSSCWLPVAMGGDRND
jgi:hypothetical protein